MGTHLTVTELSNEYQYDRVNMVFNNICVIVLWTSVASALEGLSEMWIIVGDLPFLAGSHISHSAESLSLWSS